MTDNFTHYKGSNVVEQIMNIFHFTIDNLNLIEKEYYEFCHQENKKNPENIPTEEYTNMLSFGCMILKYNALSKKDSKKITINEIIYNYFVINQNKLKKQFRRRKVHNCIHKKIQYYAKCFLKEFTKKGAEEMEILYK